MRLQEGGNFMRPTNRFIALAAVSCAALVVATGTSLAGSFAIREQSATGQGMSFAGMAAGGGGLSSMFWNPATITMKPGFQAEFHASVVFPDAKINPDLVTLGTVAALGGTPVSSGNIGQVALVPASYGSYQVNDRVWLGLGFNSPFGFITKAEPNWAGQIYGRSSKAFSINATPTIGYKVNDWLSVGAGLQIQYLDVNLRRAVPALGTSGIAALASAVSARAATGGLEGDGWGVGYTLGATLTPWAGTEIGIGFRSSVRTELEGNAYPALGVTVPVKAAVNLPETVSIGVSQRINEQWKVLAGAEWTNWSRLNIVPVVNTLSGAPLTALPFQYEDGWFVSVGAEYAWSPNLTLRAGLGYEWSPISDRTRDVRIPDNDRLWASIGATYQWNDKLAFDVGYTHIFVKDTPIRVVQGSNLNWSGLNFVGNTKPSVDIVSVALKYRWDEPSKPIPATIVRKY